MKPSTESSLTPEHFLEHSHWMRALARSLVLDASQVDDLVQDAWTAALERAPKPGVPLNAWLAGILRRRAAFLRRGNAHRAQRERKTARTEEFPSSEDLLERNELMQLLLAEVGALPQKYRDVLLLRYQQGLDHPELARRFDVPVATIRTWLQRGLQQLRERLDRSSLGDRRSWNLALLPLASLPGRAPARLGWGALLGKAALIVILPALGTMAWLSKSAEPVLDLRRDSSAEDVVRELRAALQNPQASPAQDRLTPSVEEKRLRGRVIDTEGRPIAGAHIYRREPLKPRTVYGLSNHEKTHGWRVSDSEGYFEAPLPESPDPAAWKWLSTYHLDYQAILFASPVDRDGSIQLTMTPRMRFPLELEVVDGMGRPVPRFNLCTSIEVDAGYEIVPVLRTTYREQQLAGAGTYEIEAAVGMPLVLRVEILGVNSGGDRSYGRRVLMPRPGNPEKVRIEVDLHGQSGGLHEGRVIDGETGQPIPGVEIAAISVSSRRWQTRMDGSFALDPGAAGERLAVRVAHPQYCEETLILTPAGDHELLLRPRAQLSMRVVDRAGNGIEGAHLLIKREAEDKYSTFETVKEQWRLTTDAEGRAILPHLVADSYFVALVEGPLGPDDSAFQRKTIRVRRGVDRELLFTQNPPDLVDVRGRVRGPAGFPGDYLPVFLPRESEGGWVIGEPTPGGGYRAGGLERGAYLVALISSEEDSHLPWALLHRVEVDGLATQKLDFSFPTGRAEGRIQTDSPASFRVLALPQLPEGFVRDVLTSEDRREAMAVSVDSKGRFQIEHLAAGTWSFLAYDAAGILVDERVEELSGGHDLLSGWSF